MISLSHWGEFDLSFSTISGWLTNARQAGQWHPAKDFEFQNKPSTKADYENVLQKLNFGPELT
jgi:hypothetical protein